MDFGLFLRVLLDSPMISKRSSVNSRMSWEVFVNCEILKGFADPEIYLIFY